jgi:thioredoxin 1
MSLKIVNSVSEFTTAVTESSAVLVDFFAEWCGPCRMLSPVLDELSKDLIGKLKIIKVNIDSAPDLASSMKIKSIPTMILFLNGKPHDTKMGFLNASQIKDWLKSSGVSI